MSDGQVILRFNKSLYFMFSPQLLAPEKETPCVQYQPHTVRITARMCQHTQHKAGKYTYAPVLLSVKRNTVTIAVWAVVL